MSETLDFPVLEVPEDHISRNSGFLALSGPLRGPSRTSGGHSRYFPRPSRPFAWTSDKIPRSQILTQHFGTKDSWVVRTWDLRDLPDLPDPRSPRSQISSPGSPDPGTPLVPRPALVPDFSLPRSQIPGMWSQKAVKLGTRTSRDLSKTHFFSKKR